MRDEYDFSKGERGKFYNANAKYNLPLYLEADVLDYFSAKAKANLITHKPQPFSGGDKASAEYAKQQRATVQSLKED